MKHGCTLFKILLFTTFYAIQSIVPNRYQNAKFTTTREKFYLDSYTLLLIILLFLWSIWSWNIDYYFPKTVQRTFNFCTIHNDCNEGPERC